MSSESRIWEIRLFGSMRGGRELVIGPWPFNPSSPAYSTSESGRFFRDANRAVLPEPIDEANRCDLRHVTPKTLQKALYVGLSESGRPLPVVCLGWSQFPVPEARHLVAERVAVLEPQTFHDHQPRSQPDRS